jgi:beta-lactam-binding protein with PASTA domain
MIINHSFIHSEMSPGSVMDVMVSNGNGVFVPDFEGMDRDQIIAAANDAGVLVVFEYRNYPGPDGSFIDQSVEEGEVIGEDEPVIITMSLGPA